MFLSSLTMPSETFSFSMDLLYPRFLRGVTFTWEDHAKQICEDVSNYLGGKDLDIIYISNRIYSYTVMATDWLKFFRNSYNLRGYYVVGNSKRSLLNSTIENLFFNSKIKRFNSIEGAINFAEQTRFILQDI